MIGKSLIYNYLNKRIPNLKINILWKTSAHATTSRFSEFDNDRLFVRKSINVANTLPLLTLNINLLSVIIVLSATLTACSKSDSVATNTDTNTADNVNDVNGVNDVSGVNINNSTDTEVAHPLDSAFFVPLGSHKSISISVLDIPETIYGIDMFCTDDFKSLPAWSIVFGTPKPITYAADYTNTTEGVGDIIDIESPRNINSINFDKAFMTFDANNRLQRSVLTLQTSTQQQQNQIFNALKDYFSTIYQPLAHEPTHTALHSNKNIGTDNVPLFSKKMPTNDVIKGFYRPYYIGQVYEGMTTYDTNDGYLLVYKRTKGKVIAPKSMRLSFNGVFAEYSNLGTAWPTWVQATPKKMEVIVNHYSPDFAQVYETTCR